MLFLQPHFFLDSGTVYAHVHDVRIEMDQGLRFEAVPCPACGGAMRDFFSPPAQLILKKGLLPDALYFNDLYVSERFRAAWENEGLTGIEAFAPVEAVRRLGIKGTIDEKYRLAEMGQSPALESVKRMAVSCRRGIAAAFLCTQAGDGDYEIHVDNIKEAGSIKIGPL